ncbi:hypothetical protein ACFOYW_15325 [Gryllotalpicola reticulitermitis]|uniref:Uncharacterized protein n=1 Tax=Gryllotalpicola reticulitermitis TaxID=1184153 RepID=A0ABV8QA90_9MICO
MSNQHPLTVQQMHRILDLAIAHSSAVRDIQYTDSNGPRDYTAEDAAWGDFCAYVTELCNPDQLLRYVLSPRPEQPGQPAAEPPVNGWSPEDYDGWQDAPVDPASLIDTDCRQ